jgi:hypothetical protein
MRKPLMTIAGVVVSLACIIGVKTASSRQTPVDDMAQLKALNTKFIHNFVTNDMPSHDQIIHERFDCITPSGKWLNRKDYLERWKTGFDPEVYLYWDYRNENIAIMGNVAFVRSVTKYITLKDGKETMGMTQYTDTYIKEDRTWKCTHVQLTTVTPENYPGDETIVKKYIKGKIQQ